MRVTARMAYGRGFFFCLLASSMISAPAGAEVRRVGSYAASAAAEAIRQTDAADPANIHLMNENFRFTTEAGSAAFKDGRAYVVDGQRLQMFDRYDLVTGPLLTYDAGAQLLDVETGHVPGEVLILTRTALKILNMSSASGSRIQVLSSTPVRNTQPVWGNLLTVFGSTVYVADQSIRGFRVIDISDSNAPRQIARYRSKAQGSAVPESDLVTDLRRDGKTLALIVGGAIDLVEADNPLRPRTLTSVGDARFEGVTLGAIKDGYAFLVGGSKVRVINTSSDTAGFLTEELTIAAGADITDVQIYRNRLYLLCGNQGYEVWDVSDYYPR